jgi:antitoxin HicB
MVLLVLLILFSGQSSDHYPNSIATGIADLPRPAGSRYRPFEHLTRSFAMTRDHAYSVVLHPEPEGGYTVRVPAFPEIVTFGRDEQDALLMAREAIELSVEYRLATGDEIPAEDATILRTISVALPAAA